MPFDIRAPNLQEVRDRYDGAPQVIEEEIDDAVSGVLAEMAEWLASYPPELPNQRYVRTGDLGNAWLSADTAFAIGAGGRVDMLIANPVPYGPYVQDEEQQARVHQGRWRTVQDAQRAAEPLIQEALETAFARAQARIDEE